MPATTLSQTSSDRNPRRMRIPNRAKKSALGITNLARVIVEQRSATFRPTVQSERKPRGFRPLQRQPTGRLPSVMHIIANKMRQKGLPHNPLKGNQEQKNRG